MGRRPNPLMAEFFDRGTKIADQSNRYAQTCKRCGKHFERGRNEQMIPHLTKQCPNVSYAERAKIIFRLHDLAVPDVHPYIDPNYQPEGRSNETQAGNDAQAQGTGNGMLAGSSDNNQVQVDDLLAGPPTNNQINGLDALVEATQHVGRNTPNNADYTPADQLGHGPLDPRLGANSLPVTTSAAIEGTYSFVGGLTALPIASAGTSGFTAVASAAHAPFADGAMATPGIQTSNATSRHILENPQDHAFPLQEPGNFSYYDPARNESLVPAHAADAAPTQQLSSIAMHTVRQSDPLSEETDTLPGGSLRQQKARSRFAPERRDQVRKIRELGACIRCRMLRKVCSANTPCHTCTSIETPRLWKLSCVRTKLDEAFPVYFLMPFSVLTHKELETLKTQTTSNTSAGKLEAFHFSDSKMIFKARQFVDVYVSSERSLQPVLEDEVLALDLETDNVLPKVEQYLQAICTELIDKEPWPAIRVSLQMAQAIREEHAGNILADKSDKPDDLLSKVIELWLATVVMTDTQTRPHFTHGNGLENGRRVIDQTMQPASYRLLRYQLRAAIEKRASVVCKAVLHQFEQRILRNKCKNFETMLVSFILMNCSERMCWLYQCWALPNGAWPLDAHPLRYAEKAEAFADLIQMLLNLRQSEPKIMAHPLTGALVARNLEDTALNNWLTAVGFTSNPAAHFGPGDFTPDDSRSLDGTLSARLLQTEPAT